MSGVLPLHQLAPRLAVGEFKNHKKLILTPPLNVKVTVACATVGRSNIYCCFLSCYHEVKEHRGCGMQLSTLLSHVCHSCLPPLLIAHVQTLSLCYIRLRQVEESNLLASSGCCCRTPPADYSIPLMNLSISSLVVNRSPSFLMMMLLSSL